MTLSQKLASNPELSVYVSASAGSGKTKVLTDRVLRLLLDGNDPAKIICLTYTKAAASEMLSRITEKINSWLLLSDADLKAQLLDLTGEEVTEDRLLLARKLYFNIIDDIDGIKIYTIHSFCQNIIKRFPIEAGIAPHFKLMDDNSSNDLLEEAKIRLLTYGLKDADLDDPKKIALLNNALNNIALYASETSFSANIKSIISNNDKFEELFSSRSLEQISQDFYDQYGVNFDDSEEGIIYNCYKEYNLGQINQYAEILFNSKNQGPKKQAEKLKLFYTSINKNEDIIDNFDSYKRVFYKSDLVSLNKSLVTKDIENNNPEIFAWLVREREKIVQLIDKINSLKTIKTTIDYLHIAEAILVLYNLLKQNRALIDYNDLISKAKNLLSNQSMSAWVLYKLDGGIDHVLIDESQDTSPVQWQVVEAICDEFFSGDNASEHNRTIFIVGDEKQSIYSFQGADPVVFNNVQKTFSLRAGNAHKQWKNISLDKSFRSVEAVLNLVDKVFTNDKVSESIKSNIEYKHHISHRKGQYGKVEMWPIIRKEKTEEVFTIPDKIIEDKTLESQLAAQIADNVENWLSSKRVLRSSGKVIEPEDIMILLKKRGKVFSAIIKEFENRKIPISGSDRLNVKKTLIIQDLIAFANFLLNTSDDLSLAGILKSPFIGLNEAELFELCYDRGESAIWKVLKNSDNGKYKEIAAYLTDILYKVDIVSPFELFHHIINSNASLVKIYSANGLDVKQILDEFMTLVLQYQKTNTPTLQGYIKWLKSQKSDVKRELENNAKIRIMTVHGSKGLQSPIVIIPDAESVPIKQKENILYCDNNIFFFNAVNELNSYCKGLKDSKSENDFKEYYRLLYVAMTRAEDELYITGCYKFENISEKSWYHIIEQEMRKIAVQFEDNLVYEKGGDENCSKEINDNEIESKNPPLPGLFKQQVGNLNNIDKSEVINPSKIDNTDFDDHKASLRGKIIHNLLQFLPQLSGENIENQALECIEKHGDIFDSTEREDILTNVITVINSDNTKFLFESTAKAEVPIIGKINGKTVSGRIDRLIVKDDEVFVVDYKTTKKVPNHHSKISKSSLNQLEIYKTIISDIYPQKTVKACIVWTANCEVTFI